MENSNNRHMESHDRIDDLFRQTLGTYQAEPGKGMWQGINRKLLIREIMHFNFSNMPVTYWIGGIGGIVIIPLILYLALMPAKESMVKPEQKSRSDQVVTLPGTISSPRASSNPSAGKTSDDITNKLTRISNAGEDPSQNEKPSLVIITPSSISANSASQSIGIKATTDQKKIEANRLNKNPEHSQKKVSLTAVASKTKDYASIYPMSAHLSLYSLVRDTSRFPAPDMVELGVFPANYREHEPVPQYFSVGLGIMPELTFHKSTSSYSKVDYCVGANIAWHIMKFYIRPGISIGYMYDDGIYQVSYKHNDSIGFYYQVVSFNPDPHHPGELNYQTVKRTVFDSIVHLSRDQTRNRYQFIQIPLMLGFDVYETRNFRLSVQAGPAVSFFTGDRETIYQSADLSDARLLSREQRTYPLKKANWQIWREYPLLTGSVKTLICILSQRINIISNPW